MFRIAKKKKNYHFAYRGVKYFVHIWKQSRKQNAWCCMPGVTTCSERRRYLCWVFCAIFKGCLGAVIIFLYVGCGVHAKFSASADPLAHPNFFCLIFAFTYEYDSLNLIKQNIHTPLKFLSHVTCSAASQIRTKVGRN